MKEKNKTCKYCSKEIEAKTTRQEFCSPKCRVYWNREKNVAEVEIPKSTPTASNKPIVAPKKENTTSNAGSGALSSFERMRLKRQGF
jgi:ribosomal protein L24E